jgi:hypothetical protein
VPSLRRYGATAAFATAVTFVWSVVGIFVIAPSAGLGPDASRDPATLLPFVAENGALWAALNLLGPVLGAALAIIAILALRDLLKQTSPAGSEIGIVFAAIGMVSLALGTIVSYSATGLLATIYAEDNVGATHAFYAVRAIIRSVGNLRDLAFGLGALILGGTMSRAGRTRGAGYVGILMGAVYLLGILPFRFLTPLTILLSVTWFVWVGLILQSSRA